MLSSRRHHHDIHLCISIHFLATHYCPALFFSPHHTIKTLKRLKPTICNRFLYRAAHFSPFEPSDALISLNEAFESQLVLLAIFLL